MSQDKIIRSWNDLPEQDRSAALKDDIVFASLKSAYSDADFSERDKLLQRYAIELKCSYCDGIITANFLKGIPEVCPFCKRKSDGLVINPSKVSDWLKEHYTFKSTFFANKIRLYVYKGLEGYYSERSAEAIIARESKVLFGNSLTSQKLTNVRINLIATTAVDNLQLYPAVRQIDKGIAINVKNGVVCLTGTRYESIELKPHSPDYLFTGVLNVEYDPNARPYEILKFISEVSEGDLQLAISILEAYAFTLTPGYPIHKAILLQGPHNNGKSKTVDVIQALLGEDNVENMSLQRITYNRFALDWLKNKLANISPDLPTQAITDGGVFKALTGEDKQDIERKGDQIPDKLRNSAKLLFTANELPLTYDSTNAFFDRWHILQFKHTFSGNVDVLPKLTTPQELNGLFYVLVKYFVPTLMLNRRFVGMPIDINDNINAMRDIYLKNSDNVRAFAEACLQYDPDADTPKANYYATYVRYCDKYDLIAKPEVAFWRRLKQLVTYTEHRPERGGPVWIRGQALSEPQEEDGQSQRVDMDALLKDTNYQLYAEFLNEPVQKEVFEKSITSTNCTDSTRITGIQLYTDRILYNEKIYEYIVKSLLSLFNLCNNNSTTQNSNNNLENPATNPTEISGEPSKILVNLVNPEQGNSVADQEKATKAPNPTNSSFQENENSNAPSAMDSPTADQEAARSSPQPTASGPSPDADHEDLAIIGARKAVSICESTNKPLDVQNPSPEYIGVLDGLFSDEVADALKTLERLGEIYQPRPGIWHFVHGNSDDYA